MLKLTIERAHLLKALKHTQSIVERRQTIPILSNVLIETGPDGIVIRATDNEIEIVEKVPAIIQEEGAITVPAHRLCDIVSRLPDGVQISLSATENNQLSLVAGRAKFSLATLPTDGFPSMVQENMPFSFAVSGTDLLDLIGKTSFAVSTEETRYNLNGIYLHEKAGETPRLTAVATDGHRLASAFIPLPDGATGIPGVIIPRKTITEISKLASESESEINISLSANQIRFHLGDVVLASRLIDGTYPEYEKVIPAGNDKVLEADSAVLTDVIERVSVVSEKSRGIKLSIQNNLIQVSAAAADEGSAEDEMDATYTGDNLEIGFNFRYLLDILSQIKGGTVQLLMNDSVSPVILKDTQDSNALYVLMPMRV
ncbi:MAG: DNA polymerase III subunit beta [Pseudomonadota bacterium]|nr:DNA polymerase III subunit beta [Pseudomonadota bacterium]